MQRCRCAGRNPGDRGEAGEARGAFGLEGAELGHLDQHGKGGGVADAGDAHENGEAGLQGGIGGELGMQGGVDRGDLTVDLRQTRSGLTLEQRCAVPVVAVAGGDPVLDQGAAGDMQLLHRVDGRAGDGPHRRLEQGGEAGEQRRVDGIVPRVRPLPGPRTSLA